MTPLVKRVLKLSEEIEHFPLGQCSPSDDSDKQTAYLYSFKDLVKRFISSAKRLDDNELEQMICKIGTSPESIIEAYDLKAELQGIIDYINDSKSTPNKIKEKAKISAKSASKLISIIRECLISESANNLPMICNGYGLIDGDINEAFKSKSNYVHSRISHLEPKALYVLGLKMKGKYSSELDVLLDKIAGNDEIGLVSSFENIQNLLKEEINNAKFTIWIAVSWFTDTQLANLLFSKSKEGVNVQIILNDDTINSKLKDKLNQFFEVHWVCKKSMFDKIMHNKFCVIDLEVVIHGSYNWTKKARYNDETISVIKSRIFAEEFAENFLKLKKELIKKVADN